MRLYTTVTALIVFFFTSLTLSAQDVVDKKDLRDKQDLRDFDDIDMRGIVRDYVRAGRTTTKTVIKGKRFRTGEDLPFEKIGLAISVGSAEFGIKFSTPINEKFKMRLGGGYMPPILSVKKTFDVDDPVLKMRVSDVPQDMAPLYKVKFKPSFYNVHALIDYYPIEDNAFHVTAGLYFGENTIEARGELRNPVDDSKLHLDAVYESQGWPWLQVEGRMLKIDDGNLDADLKMGFFVKPYVGVGYGYVVPESNWSFNVDLGVMFQGKYKIHQYGKEAPKNVDSDFTHHSDAIDIKKYKSRVMMWPVLSVQVAYRIY